MTILDGNETMHRSAPASAIEALARVSAFLGGAITTVIALTSVTSITLRSLGFQPIQGDFELVQVGLAAAIALFLPWCQLKGGNILVDFFTAGASVRTQRRLDCIGAVLT
ncbi:MAG: TRAP transporter small permease, partial [Burkholderiales bacterium]